MFDHRKGPLLPECIVSSGQNQMLTDHGDLPTYAVSNITDCSSVIL